mgnify:CR=1 FL=1
MMLSERLKKIALLIPKDSNVADIGCDHGYLLIYLKDSGFAGKLLGVENKIGPLTSFRNNLKSKGYLDSIKYSLSDGLKDVDETYDTVVIAGMGYDSIKKIVDDSLEKIGHIKSFIIDSHTKEYEIRKLFTKLGYMIDSELILKEKGIFYEIIRFVRGNSNYNEMELHFGPLLMKEKSQIFLEKWQNKYENNKKIITKINDNKKVSKLTEDCKLIAKLF